MKAPKAASSARVPTPGEAAFVLAYVRCRNATAAAREAGFSPNSVGGAAVTGHRLLRRPHVRALLVKAQRAWERAFLAVTAAAAREYAERMFGAPPPEMGR